MEKAQKEKLFEEVAPLIVPVLEWILSQEGPAQNISIKIDKHGALVSHDFGRIAARKTSDVISEIKVGAMDISDVLSQLNTYAEMLAKARHDLDERSEGDETKCAQCEETECPVHPSNRTAKES